RLVLIAPEIRRITPRRDELAAAVLFVNDVAAQIAQRRLQHVKNKFRPGRSTRGARTQFSTELVLMFRFREIAERVGRRSEKDEPPSLVEQDYLVKHLENFRAGLVNG